MSNLNLQKLREWVWRWPWTFNGGPSEQWADTEGQQFFSSGI